MEDGYEPLFSRIERADPPEELFGLVMRRIEREALRRYRRLLLLHGTTLAGAAILLVPALQYFFSQFAQSGFSRYFSLFFSDPHVALAFWQDFSLSLLASIPIFSVIAVLAVLLAILFSLKKTLQDVTRTPVVFHS